MINHIQDWRSRLAVSRSWNEVSPSRMDNTWGPSYRCVAPACALHAHSCAAYPSLQSELPAFDFPLHYHDMLVICWLQYITTARDQSSRVYLPYMSNAFACKLKNSYLCNSRQFLGSTAHGDDVTCWQQLLTWVYCYHHHGLKMHECYCCRGQIVSTSSSAHHSMDGLKVIKLGMLCRCWLLETYGSISIWPMSKVPNLPGKKPGNMSMQGKVTWCQWHCCEVRQLQAACRRDRFDPQQLARHKVKNSCPYQKPWTGASCHR